MGISQEAQRGDGARGVIVISLPNVRHHSISVPLLFRGEFEYQDAGLMDRTHLRFFTLEGAKKLLESAGLKVTTVVAQGIEWEPKRFWRYAGMLPFVSRYVTFST